MALPYKLCSAAAKYIMGIRQYDSCRVPICVNVANMGVRQVDPK